MYKGGVKNPPINTWELAQLDRHRTGNTTVIGLRVQAMLEVTSFAESILLYYNSGIVAEMVYINETPIIKNYSFAKNVRILI